MAPWIYPIDPEKLHGVTIPTSKSLAGQPEWAQNAELLNSEQAELTPGTALQPGTLSDRGNIDTN